MLVFVAIPKDQSGRPASVEGRFTMYLPLKKSKSPGSQQKMPLSVPLQSKGYLKKGIINAIHLVDCEKISWLHFHLCIGHTLALRAPLTGIKGPAGCPKEGFDL